MQLMASFAQLCVLGMTAGYCCALADAFSTHHTRNLSLVYDAASKSNELHPSTFTAEMACAGVPDPKQAVVHTERPISA